MGLNYIFDVNILWNAPTFLENLSIWVSNMGSLLYLPLFLMWNIWKARNRMCFYDRKPIMTSLLHIIFEEVNTFKPLLKHRHKIRNIGKSPTSVFPMIFFDGTATNNIGGAGFFLWLNEQHLLAFKLGCGSCTNT